nr:hypothetical protein [Tanacetum cinerariifolium]
MSSSTLDFCLFGLDFGVDILLGSRDTNLYTIAIDDMLKTFLICLLSKASKTKSWLWHHRLSHFNFGTLNKLAKYGLARGIPKLQFQKDHLCSTCALEKSKKFFHQPKDEDTNQEKLYLLHMDLCGPMCVGSINRKRYILVIVDDYSRFTWIKFLRIKDEAPKAIIKFIKNIQVSLKATVQNVRTDNGTEFINQTLREFYENIGILHPISVARIPQQNDKPDLSYLHVFGSLRYPTIESEDLGKLDVKADIGIFVGYVLAKKVFIIYTRRTQKIMETIHVLFDELTAMASEQFGSGPGLQSMTPATSSSRLVLNPIPQQPFPVVVAPRAVDITNSHVSTSIDQDAPSTSILSTQEQEHSPIVSQGFEESPKTSHFHDDPLYESLHEDSTSQGSSSNVRPITNPFESLGRWTKDHPITNVIGDPSRSVSTRKQLETDDMWYYFDAFLTSVEPKNFKQAMTKPSWIDAMQEEIHEFKRLEVWELMSCLDRVMLIKLKIICTGYKNRGHPYLRSKCHQQEYDDLPDGRQNGFLKWRAQIIGEVDPTLFTRKAGNDLLLAKPIEKHLHEVKQIFRYLKGTINMGLNMNLVLTQQIVLKNALVAPEKRLKIERCNARIEFSKPQREETYQVTLDALKLSHCYPTFLITTEVSKIYMHQFWNIIKKIGDSDAYNFNLDKKKCRGSDFILEVIEAYLKDESISPEIDHADCDPDGDICLIEKLLNDDPFQLPPMDLKQGEIVKAKSSIEEPSKL